MTGLILNWLSFFQNVHHRLRGCLWNPALLTCQILGPTSGGREGQKQQPLVEGPLVLKRLLLFAAPTWDGSHLAQTQVWQTTTKRDWPAEDAKQLPGAIFVFSFAFGTKTQSEDSLVVRKR